MAISNSPTVVVRAATLTVGGAVSGASDLTKDGPGVLVFSGVAGYSGVTTVSAGTLAFTNTALPASSMYSVASGTANLVMGATIQSGQSPTFSGDGTVTLNGANTLSINNSNFNGMNPDSTLDLEFSGTNVALINSGDNPLANFQGTLNIGASSTAEVGNVTIQCNVLTGSGTLGSPAVKTFALNILGGSMGTFAGNLSAANGEW